ncbi:MAG TPA: low molecular weight protein arginine phosphatase [Bacillus sp. (in: firmicutes)]|uniref:low molecular weight protein arginine phosphatase n=1 Tax=Bacillus litorisediminis TaxID=2922713 RepID=UPI001FADBD37|nr:low molecular weight protein arginine phosphatase [Bacillus litorisediminis]HWO78121.1 low molecular weight protein arginine phosphatase [Bacillus sp. (in: firmicutes)]
MKRLLFVCTGNTCRSPMAAAIMNQLGIEAKSAGIFAAAGSDASPHTKQVLSENNIEYKHASQPVTPEILDWATHILTMTENHKWHLLSSYPSVQDKTFTIREFVDESGDVIDPFGGSLEEYRQTFSELNELMKKVIKKLDNEV